MTTTNQSEITVETSISKPIEKVWELWTLPEHIIKWNHASDDWHTPFAENDPITGGKFLWRMEAKDGSFGFDFEGVYNNVVDKELLTYSMADGRNVKIGFIADGDKTNVKETFDPESINPVEMQKEGWQAILNNFKKYAESI